MPGEPASTRTEHTLASLSWPEAAAAAAATLLVPVGSLEQHGPHLPLDTDTRLAVAFATAAAARTPAPVLVTPPVAFAASGEHAGFPGTLSIGTEVLTALLVELGRSADHFARIVFVNGHGGNADALRRAVAVLHGEGRRARAWSWSAPGADAHAGRTETSLLLALAPEAVDLAAAEPGVVAPIAELMDALRRGGVAAVSANGVLGDPTGASASHGEARFARCVDDLVAFLEDDADPDGVMPGAEPPV